MNGDGSRRYVIRVDPKDIKDRFRLLLELPDEQLPLDVLCYLLCQLAGDDIVVEDEQRKIDEIAGAIPPTFEGVMSFLFAGSGGIRANTDNYYDIDNSLISRVRASGKGIPITMSVIAMECARRVHVPMVGIGLPGHFIVRSTYDQDLFADPFNGGDLLDRQGVRRLFQRVAGPQAPWSDSYLRSVSKRDIVFRILNNLKVACKRSYQGRPMLAWVLELLSWFPEGQPFDPREAARALSPYN
jgi:regulator of sirC expression with transglutaminase-like and TPR domain